MNESYFDVGCLYRTYKQKEPLLIELESNTTDSSDEIIHPLFCIWLILSAITFYCILIYLIGSNNTNFITNTF